MKMAYVYNKPRLLPYYLPTSIRPVPQLSVAPVAPVAPVPSSMSGFNGMFARISNMKIGCSSCGK